MRQEGLLHACQQGASMQAPTPAAAVAFCLRRNSEVAPSRDPPPMPAGAALAFLVVAFPESSAATWSMPMSDDDDIITTTSSSSCCSAGAGSGRHSFRDQDWRVMGRLRRVVRRQRISKYKCGGWMGPVRGIQLAGRAAQRSAARAEQRSACRSSAGSWHASCRPPACNQRTCPRPPPGPPRAGSRPPGSRPTRPPRRRRR
jgi:hypothetical protein